MYRKYYQLEPMKSNARFGVETKKKAKHKTAVVGSSVEVAVTSENAKTRLPTSPISRSIKPLLVPIIMLLLHRTALRRRSYTSSATQVLACIRCYHPTGRLKETKDPRLSNLGHLIEDDFAVGQADG